MNDSATAGLQAVLHHDIPLTREMGLTVHGWHLHRLRLGLPLAPNVNHKSTMFGGSLYCAAVLAGWSWLHLRQQEEGLGEGHIVIQEGQISYPLPVTGDAIAVCPGPEEHAWQRFITTYRRRGRARLSLDTWVSNAGSEDKAVLFSGQYVLHR